MPKKLDKTPSGVLAFKAGFNFEGRGNVADLSCAETGMTKQKSVKRIADTNVFFKQLSQVRSFFIVS